MEFLEEENISNQKIKEFILDGKIFIYPTDTIYGIGCNAKNKASVKEIRKIKRRDEKPFSVIAPSKKWIEENCIVDVNLNKYLPGPYTLILKKKNPEFLKHVSDSDSIGVRIPNNSFIKKIQSSGVPFITTSVNFSGETPIKEISEIKKEIMDKVDYIVDEGVLNGSPSILIINRKEIKR